MELLHSEELLKAIIWLAVTSIVAGIAWIFKSIIKPWSDAALKRSEAFVAHVDTVGKCLTSLSGSFTDVVRHTETSATALVEAKGQLSAIAASNECIEKSTSRLDKWPSDLVDKLNSACRFSTEDVRHIAKMMKDDPEFAAYVEAKIRSRDANALVPG